jgi:hypothetical protein
MHINRGVYMQRVMKRSSSEGIEENQGLDHKNRELYVKIFIGGRTDMKY